MANEIVKHRLYICTDFCTLSQFIMIILQLPCKYSFFILSPFEEIYSPHQGRRLRFYNIIILNIIIFDRELQVEHDSLANKVYSTTVITRLHLTTCVYQVRFNPVSQYGCPAVKSKIYCKFSCIFKQIKLQGQKYYSTIYSMYTLYRSFQLGFLSRRSRISGLAYQRTQRNQQFAQSAHDKRANEQIARFFERIAPLLFRSQKTSNSLKKSRIKSYFYVR